MKSPHPRHFALDIVLNNVRLMPHASVAGGDRAFDFDTGHRTEWLVHSTGLCMAYLR